VQDGSQFLATVSNSKVLDATGRPLTEPPELGQIVCPERAYRLEENIFD
jgi:hypothetical protein